MILQIPFRHVFIDKGQMIFVLAIANQGYQVPMMYPCQVLSLQHNSENCSSEKKFDVS